MTGANRVSSIRRIALFILRNSLPIIALALSLAVYYSTSFYDLGDFVYNSDSLYLPAFYADLIHGANLSQWNLPPSSYIFPDMLLYLGARAITANLQSATVVFGITQYLIFVLGLMLLAKQTLPGSYRSISPSLIALMSICFILSLTNLEFYNQMLFVSAHHFGIVLMTPFVLAITHRLIFGSRDNIPLVSLLSGLSFLTTLSDGLCLIQVALPLVAVLVILYGLKKVELKRTLIVSGALMLPSLFGIGASLIYSWNRPSLMEYMFKPHPIDFSLAQLAVSLASLPLYQTLWTVIFLGLCAITLVKIVFLRQGASLNSASSLVPIYFFLAFIINTLVVIGSGVFTDRDGFRYFLPVLLFSGFWGLPFIVTIPKMVKPVFFEWGLTGAIGLGIFLAWGSIDRQGFSFDYYPPFIQCIDEKTATLGVRYGIANYWQARPISMLSQNNLRVVQVNRDLSPYHWINNSAEYTIQPEFVVIDTSFPENYPFRLDEDLLVNRFGKPDAAFLCERSKILVYRSNDKFRFLFGKLRGIDMRETLQLPLIPMIYLWQ